MRLEEKLRLAGRSARILGDPRGVRILASAAGNADDVALVVFAANRAELVRHEAAAIASARADRVTWIAYPKGGQLGTDLSRDDLWRSLVGKGIQPVTSVSIDAIWTALRFRPAEAVEHRTSSDGKAGPRRPRPTPRRS
jgi:hypothetical protein